MLKLTPVRILAAIIFFYSLVVMLGWIFNINALTGILPNQIGMQFITAFSFSLAAIGLWFMDLAVNGKSDIPFVILPGTAMLILLILTTSVAAEIFGVHTGITDLFIAGNNAINTPIPGMPSPVSVLGFILFSVAMILSLFNSFNLNKKILYFHAVPLILIGSVGVLGYIFNLPFLYYKFIDGSNPIALNTALMFILLGLGVFLTERSKINENKP
jgi:hypothetical protein